MWKLIDNKRLTVVCVVCLCVCGQQRADSSTKFLSGKWESTVLPCRFFGSPLWQHNSTATSNGNAKKNLYFITKMENGSEWSEMLIFVTCTSNSQHSEHSNQVENSIQRNTDVPAERKQSAQQLKLNPEKISTWYHCWQLASEPLTNCVVGNTIARVKDFRQNNCMDKNKWWKWNGRMPLQRMLPEPNRNPHSENCELRYVRT